MRLIDADALPRFGRRGGLIHAEDVDRAPTVDAIPIEYIQYWIDKQNYGRRNGKMMLAKALNELITEWRKEHEQAG